MDEYELSFTAEKIDALLQKVDSGGSSGGNGGEHTISLDSHNISVLPLVMAGGGTTLVEGIGNFWELVNEYGLNSSFEVLSAGQTYELRLSSVRIKNGEIMGVVARMSEVMTEGVLTNITVYLSWRNMEAAYVTAVVENVPIPQ